MRPCFKVCYKMAVTNTFAGLLLQIIKANLLNFIENTCITVFILLILHFWKR